MTEMREALNQAFVEAENEETEEIEEDAKKEETLEEPTEPTEEPTSDAGNEVEEKAEETTSEVQKEDPTPKPVEEAAKTASKAPASWSPKSREGWSKVPADAQAQINKREKEVNKVLQDSATSRQGMKQLNDTLAPYREGLVASGASDPFQAISTLLQTESTLRMGGQEQKAQTIANLMKQYGVDVGTLDNILGGEEQPYNANSQMEAMIDQRMAPVNQMLQQQAYAQQQQNDLAQQDAVSSVAQFSEGKEFINEVRNDMADLLDLASNRNQPLTMDEAYKKACAIHPEVSEVMAQRAKEQAIMGTNAQTAQKKAAAVSITGSQGGAGGGGKNLSLRDTISDIWQTGESA